MAKKKKTAITSINAHPYTPPGITSPLKPRKLRAGLRRGGYELRAAALELGLVPGDLVTGSQGGDGARYLNGISALRPGTLTSLPVTRYFCACHGPEVIDQVSRDWRSNGAVFVAERGGVVRAFWPEQIPAADAEMALERSASEFGLPPTLIPARLRPGLIAEMVDLVPFRGRSQAA